jgi:membrane-associated protease RseP (regulator of RpoE activity)
MPISMTRYGALAVVLSLSQSPMALAQESARHHQNAPEVPLLSERLALVSVGFDSGQEQSKNTDRQPNEGAGPSEDQAAARVPGLANVLLQQEPQPKEVPLNGDAKWDLETVNLLGSNRGQQLANFYWKAAGNKDGETWFAFSGEHTSGMSLVPIDNALRAHLKIPKGRGLLVTGINPQSPAAAAGLHENDVLLALGDAPLEKPDDLDAALKAVGEKPVFLHLFRGGSALEIQVQPRAQVTLGPLPPQAPPQDFWIGVSVNDVAPALRAQLKLPPNKGLLVNEVFKATPAEKAGIKINDILLSIDGTPLSEQKKLVDLVQASGGKALKVELMHEGTPRGGIEIIPERRTVRQLTVSLYRPNVFRYYNVVRPGAVVTAEPRRAEEFRWELHTDRPSHAEPAKDSNTALSKRLDELDAEIKKIRKALEEVGKASKVSEDLIRAIELLKKLSTEKK